MSELHWDQVAAIFEEIVDLPPELRESEIVRRSAGDSTLAALVAEIVAEHERAAREKFLDGPAVDVDELATGLVGASVGGFHLRRLLGQGGMGIVYVAQQERPRRDVALKILRPRFASVAAIRRFEVEAEVLGQLRHPGIAQVISSGVHRFASGVLPLDLPWIAMELLEGALPLVEYATQNDLSLHARVGLIREACAAVASAHQRGVIHRDLKPANVLVDSAGVPRVIDFGIARATGLDHHATFGTRADDLLGTLRYMAPEQVDGRADQVDVRTDVYALGLMLCEIVTERMAIDVDRRRLEDAIHAIRTAPPERPSRLRPGTPREIDWIVARCLEKDADLRYASVPLLAEDLDRFLRGEPLSAGPRTVGYRVGAWVRLHRVAVLVAASIAVGLTLWIGSLKGALDRATHAEREQRAATATAISQVERATAVNGLMQFAIGRALGGRTASELRLTDILREMGGAVRSHGWPPEVEAALCESLAEFHLQLGDLDAAEPLLSRGVQLLQDADLDDTEMMRGLRLLQARLSLARGRTQDAADRIAEADSLAQRDDPPAYDINTANEKIGRLFAEGRFTEAEAIICPMIARLSMDNADPGANLSVFQNYLALVLMSLGRFDEAEAAARAALEGELLRHPDQPARAATTRGNLAAVFVESGRSDEAWPLLTDALATLNQELGADHPRTLRLRATFARAKLASGDPAAALEVADDLIARARVAFGADHVEVARMLVLRAEALLDLGRFDDAAAELEVAVPVCEGAVRDGHPVLAFARALLGRARIGQGDRPAGQALLRRALADLREDIPSDHPRIGMISSWLKTP